MAHMTVRRAFQAALALEGRSFVSQDRPKFATVAVDRTTSPMAPVPSVQPIGFGTDRRRPSTDVGSSASEGATTPFAAHDGTNNEPTSPTSNGHLTAAREPGPSVGRITLDDAFRFYGEARCAGRAAKAAEERSDRTKGGSFRRDSFADVESTGAPRPRPPRPDRVRTARPRRTAPQAGRGPALPRHPPRLEAGSPLRDVHQGLHAAPGTPPGLRPQIDFHSSRTTFDVELIRNRVDREIRCVPMGHVVDHVNLTRYGGEGDPFEHLSDVVNSIEVDVSAIRSPF